MKKSKFKLFFFVFVLLMLLMCSLEKPVEVDGDGFIRIVVIDTTKIFSENKLNPVAECRVRIFNTDYDFLTEYYTDENGNLEVTDLIKGHYKISADKKYENYILNGSTDLDIYKSADESIDTIKVDLKKLSKIVINEVYYCGVQNGTRYYEDQFVELYNNSDSVQYLDGIIVCRLNSKQPVEKHVLAEKYFQFPGEGTEFPIQPGSFVVLAQDAIDHTAKAGNSIDLSNADFEFYTSLGGDMNNRRVHDIINLDVNAKSSSDFRLNLSKDEICILRVDNFAEVPDYELDDIIFKLFYIFDIIDGVEFSPDSKDKKSLDSYIDAGFAGYKVNCYSGKAIERQNPETGEPGYDNNNSTFDFVTIEHPTPGYQHSQDIVVSREGPL